MRRIRRHLTFANVAAAIALFLALGGGAYALSLKKGSVTSKTIKNNSIKSKDVRNDTLTGTDIQEATLSAPAARVTFDSTVNKGVPDSVSKGTTVIWNQETFDNANLHSGSSPNLTAPIAGIYQVTANVQLNNCCNLSGDPPDTSFFMWIDSSDELVSYVQNFTTFSYGQQDVWSPINLNATGLVSLNPGQVVQVGVQQYTGAGFSFPLVSGDANSNFQMAWVAPPSQTAGLAPGPHAPAPQPHPVP